MFYLLPILIGLMPLAVAPRILVYFDSTPRMGLLLTGAAALLVCAGRSRTSHSLLDRTAGRFFTILLLAQCVSLIVSASLAQQPRLAFLGTGWRLFGAIPQIGILVCAFFAAADLAAHPRHFQWILRTIACTGMAAAAYGVAQYAGWDPILHADQVQFSMHFRPPGTFGNPTYFANYLIFVIFAGIGTALGAARRWKFVGCSAAVVGTFALVLTGTRSAVLGLLVGLAILAFQKRPRLTAVRALSGAAFIAGLTCFVLSPAGSKLRDRLDQWVQDPTGGPRLMMWRDTLRMSSAHLAAGQGPEVFAGVFPAYQSESLARAYPDHYEESPHNIVLDALAAQGIPGAIILLVLSGMGLAGRRSEIAGQAAAIASACVGAEFIAHQFTVFIIPTALLYALFIGAAAGLRLARKNPQYELYSPGWMQSWAPRLVALMMVAVAARVAYVDMKWATVKRRMDSGDVSSAMSGYRDISKLQPADPELALWYSRALLEQLGKIANPVVQQQALWQVVQASRQACATSEDRQNAFYNLALVYARLGDASEMETALRGAIAVAPNWYKPHWLLAELLLHTNQVSRAGEEARRAVYLSGGKHPETEQTLAATRRITAGL